MKNFIRLFVILTTLAFMTGCSLTRTNLSGTTENRILGLWEVRAIHNSDESGYKETPPGMFKMVFKDGTFMNFMSTEDGAIITVDGSYVIKDDIYTENIVNSFNKSQEGKANHLNFKLSNENFMYLRWFQPIDEFGVVQNRWIEEIWQRVLIEDLEVSNVDLQQELRSLLYDDELIKKVIK